MDPPNYVVRIRCKGINGIWHSGTGFIVNKKGHVATCLHVVSETDEIAVQLPYYEPWRYMVSDKFEEEDLVLLKGIVPPSIETPHALLHSDWLTDTNVGDELTVWGCSAQEHFKAPQRFDCSISGFSEKYARIGLNGDINPGDSGAPVIDAYGRVIGIVHARDKHRYGQAMAIPISFLSKVNPEIEINDMLQDRETAFEPNVVLEKLKLLEQLYSEKLIPTEMKTEYTRKILDRHLLER